MEWKIVHIAETDSTNRWLKANEEEARGQRGGSSKASKRKLEGDDPRGSFGVVVRADFQTAGRGCGTNTWESERGKNLLFSMLIFPEEIPANQQFHITEIASVAMCETLRAYTDEPVTIKWPNDIYVGDRKICGMLIENTLQGNVLKDSIIGIGLNVNQREFHSDAPNPVSLYQLRGCETDLDEVLSRFLYAFDSCYQSKTTCFAYKSMLFRKQKYAFYCTKTTCFTARLTDVTPEGRLVLQDEAGQLSSYAFKEVQFII